MPEGITRPVMIFFHPRIKNRNDQNHRGSTTSPYIDKSPKNNCSNMIIKLQVHKKKSSFRSPPTGEDPYHPQRALLQILLPSRQVCVRSSPIINRNQGAFFSSRIRNASSYHRNQHDVLLIEKRGLKHSEKQPIASNFGYWCVK